MRIYINKHPVKGCVVSCWRYFWHFDEKTKTEMSWNELNCNEMKMHFIYIYCEMTKSSGIFDGYHCWVIGRAPQPIPVNELFLFFCLIRFWLFETLLIFVDLCWFTHFCAWMEMMAQQIHRWWKLISQRNTMNLSSGLQTQIWHNLKYAQQIEAKHRRDAHANDIAIISLVGLKLWHVIVLIKINRNDVNNTMRFNNELTHTYTQTHSHSLLTLASFCPLCFAVHTTRQLLMISHFIGAIHSHVSFSRLKSFYQA